HVAVALGQAPGLQGDRLLAHAAPPIPVARGATSAPEVCRAGLMPAACAAPAACWASTEATSASTSSSSRPASRPRSRQDAKPPRSRAMTWGPAEPRVPVTNAPEPCRDSASPDISSSRYAFSTVAACDQQRILDLRELACRRDLLSAAHRRRHKERRVRG